MREEGTGPARPGERMRVEDVPEGVENLNMDGRRLVGPSEGFGPLWQKIYRARLEGVTAPSELIMRTWREHFDTFQPQGLRFHKPEEGLKPGAVMPVEFKLPLADGLPEMIPLTSGVQVVDAEPQRFTVMTPEGFPISGWNTFSVFAADGAPVAEIRSLLRTMDPIYEVGYRWMGGAKKQESEWVEMLHNLAAHFGVQAHVTVDSSLLDGHLQWRGVKNVIHNAAIRTLLHRITHPVQRIFRKKE